MSKDVERMMGEKTCQALEVGARCDENPQKGGSDILMIPRTMLNHIRDELEWSLRQIKVLEKIGKIGQGDR